MGNKNSGARPYFSQEPWWARLCARLLPGDSFEDCWHWQGHAEDSKSRPHVTKKNKSVSIAKVLLEEKLGRPLLPGMFACHTCNNKWCVNPSHLIEDTPKGNIQYMFACGRANKVRGEKSGTARLTEANVCQIRYALSLRLASYDALAAAYGVTASTIGRIARTQTWNHLPGQRILPRPSATQERYIQPKRSKFRLRRKINGQEIVAGYFPTLEDAKRKRDELGWSHDAHIVG